MKGAILLFDGHCDLCNGGVNFVIERDRRGIFRFASLRSEAGQALLRRFGLPTRDFHSFVMIEGDRVYQRSTAALRVALGLGGLWTLLFGFILIPAALRDRVYDVVARNRYRWFGRREVCRLPDPELAARFLESVDQLPEASAEEGGARSEELLPSQI